VRALSPSWTVEAIDTGFKSHRLEQTVYRPRVGHADKRNANTAKGLTLDEAPRIVSKMNLPKLLS
jgi:hypothetical protein